MRPQATPAATRHARCSTPSSLLARTLVSILIKVFILVAAIEHKQREGQALGTGRQGGREGCQ